MTLDDAPARGGGRSLRKAIRGGPALVAGAAVLALTLSACGGSGKSLENSGSSGSTGSGGNGSGSAASGSAAPSGSPAAKGTLVVGSAGFTESELLAQMYSQLLDNAGFKTRVQTVANRELYEPALEKGEIDVVPEYAATMAEFLNTKKNGSDAKPVASSDASATIAALKKLATPRGLGVLKPSKALDQNAFAVSKSFADKHHLKTLSDLGKSGIKVSLAAGDECKTRPYCMPGLTKTYGISFSKLDPKGVGTAAAKQAVKNGQDDMVLTTSTGSTLDQFGLVILKDDKHLQNADVVLPMVNAKAAGGPKVAAALDKLSILTTKQLTALDKEVDGQQKKPAEVAKSYLTEHHLR